ncbi:MAG: cell division protein FtsQ [Actinomycetota bacterium]|nr:cell division protein FtsQ [Actinomycetota bacterium]
MRPPNEPFRSVGGRGHFETSRDDIEVIGDVEVIDDIEVIEADVTDIDLVDDEAIEAVVVPAEMVPDDQVQAEVPAGVRRPPVDPRIRARRVAVAREQGRRRLRVVLVGLSLVVAVGSAWLLVQSPILDVDHIVVSGVPNARLAAVIAATGVHRHDALLLVSTRAVERRVERVPGIGAVRVSRDLPGTLRITVREQGAALWARAPGNRVVLVGHDGRVLQYAPAPPPHVIELRGLAHVPAPGGRVPVVAVAGVMAQLPTAMAERVGAISAANPGDVRLYLVIGGEVRLGDFSLLHDKGVAAEAVIERMACPLSYVDVRSISNPVALPAPGATCAP